MRIIRYSEFVFRCSKYRKTRIERQNQNQGVSFDPSDYEDGIYVIGAGKATLPMAAALDKLLGPLITRGLVVAKTGQEWEEKLKYIDVMHAGHPVPDRARSQSFRRDSQNC